MDDWQNHEDSDLSCRMARPARIALEFGGMIIPDDATPEELLMLVDTPSLARAAASRPIWRRFWQRERTGAQLPPELRVVPTGRSEEEQGHAMEAVRGIRRVLEARGVAVPDDATPEDLNSLIVQFRYLLPEIPNDAAVLRGHPVHGANRPGPLKVVPMFVLLGLLGTAIGFAVGVVPGLVLGLVGLHRVGAVVLPLLWAGGYVRQRRANYGEGGPITWAMAGFGACGFGTSVWLLGSITS
jgi:hypothetical protein